MNSIWEAFRALNEAHTTQGEMHVPGCEICDAARALAQATAEEIFAEHHPRLCGIWAAEFNDTMRGKIDALGKEAKP